MMATAVSRADGSSTAMGFLDALRAHAALLTYQIRCTAADPAALAVALAADLELALSELHQMHLVLRTATEEFAELLESVTEGVCQVAQIGAVTHVNAAFAALLGHASPAQLLGEAPALADLLVRPEANALIARVEAEGALQHVPVLLRRQDGELLEMLADTHARRSPTGTFVGMHAIIIPHVVVAPPSRPTAPDDVRLEPAASRMRYEPGGGFDVSTRRTRAGRSPAWPG